MKSTYKYLSECHEFELLKERYTTQFLETLEQILVEYEKSNKSERVYDKAKNSGWNAIIDLYERCIPIEDFFEVFSSFEK